jgi:phosphoribosyl 1,2-cyclic phosphodiesterase
MFYYCPLASGSKGNCIFVRAGQTRILVDCGLSMKVIQNKLAAIGECLENIQAIFITHEHGDHILGLRSITNHYPIPVICNMETAQAIAQILKEIIPCHLFTNDESFDFGDLKCLPFSVPHDAMDPVGFRISYKGIQLGLCADLGMISATIFSYLQGCHYLYIEANHDPELVDLSVRPLIYKQRVLSKLGHLSNFTTGQFISKLYHLNLKHVFLAHLSQDCNRTDLALSTIRNQLREEQQSLLVEIAPQNMIGSLVGPDGIQKFTLIDKAHAC